MFFNFTFKHIDNLLFKHFWNFQFGILKTYEILKMNEFQKKPLSLYSSTSPTGVDG